MSKHNKYAINYTPVGQTGETSHSFDTVKELKEILFKIGPVKVRPMPSEFMPNKMSELILEHNEYVLQSDRPFMVSKEPNYDNEWTEELISIVLKDNSELSRDQLAFDEESLSGFYNKGLTPKQVYFDEWEGDAGNYYKIDFEKGGSVSTDKMLEDFNIDNLDIFERRQYDHLINQSTKPETLNIIINSADGDYSQLSPELAKIAKLQKRSKSFAKGGSVSTRKPVKVLEPKFIYGLGHIFPAEEKSLTLIEALEYNDMKIIGFTPDGHGLMLKRGDSESVFMIHDNSKLGKLSISRKDKNEQEYKPVTIIDYGWKTPYVNGGDPFIIAKKITEIVRLNSGLQTRYTDEMEKGGSVEDESGHGWIEDDTDINRKLDKEIKRRYGNNPNIMVVKPTSDKPKNPLIGDSYFQQNPGKILGEQVIRKGQYGNDVVTVVGSLSDLNKIGVGPMPKQEIQIMDIPIEVKTEVIKKVTSAESKKELSKKIKTDNNSEVWTPIETYRMYNKDITQLELEAYLLTHPELHKGNYFEGEYTSNIDSLRDEHNLLMVDPDTNKHEYRYSYLSGNISGKITRLTYPLNKEAFIEKWGKEQYDKQLRELNSVKPQEKGYVGDDRIVILPHSKIAREFKITELIFGTPEINGPTSLKDAFVQWVNTLSPDDFKLSNSREIVYNYIENKGLSVSKKGRSENEIKEAERVAINTKQRSKEEGDSLFAKFLETQLTATDQTILRKDWNDKFNSVVEPNLDKIPVAFRISKKFKQSPTFRLSDTQRRAAAFITEKKSGLLAYGVGVGKTGAALDSVSQAFDNGYATRALFVVPTNTYEKWMMETGGGWMTVNGKKEFSHGILPHVNLVGLFNLSPEIVRRSLKIYSQEEEKIIDRIEKAIDYIKDFKDPKVFKTNGKEIQRAVDKLMPVAVNWEALDEAYQQKLQTGVPDAYDLLVRHLRSERDYRIYRLGVCKPYPEQTIFITTEQGIRRLGLQEGSDKDNLKSMLFEILSQGERSIVGDKKSEREALKNLQKLDNQIEERLASTFKNAKIALTDLGIDFVCFDESHYYKKLFTHVMGSVIENTEEEKEYDYSLSKREREGSRYEIKSGNLPSSRALSAFMISSYIQMKNNNRNVIQLTATPFTNSPLEIYSMLTLTNLQVLREMGLGNMQDFFDTFMKITYEIKYTAQKSITKKEVLVGFNNTPQMRTIIYSMIDKKDNQHELQRPNLIRLTGSSTEASLTGRDTKIPLTIEQEEINAQIKDYINGDMQWDDLCTSAVFDEIDNLDLDGVPDESLISMYESETEKDYEWGGEELTESQREKLITAIKNKKKSSVDFTESDLSSEEGKGVRVMKALSAFRLVTLSPYAWSCKRDKIKPSPEQYINSSPKLKYVMGCIGTVIDYHKKKGTKCSGQVIYMNAGTPFFGHIKQYLHDTYRLTEEQVVLVHGKMSKTAKEDAKRKFLDGTALVLIGSSTISVGVDLQNNASVLYNVYYDWNPTDAQQIEGRIWRQGNPYSNVRIVYPACYNSVDPVMCQYLYEKTQRINEIWDRAGIKSELDIRDFDPKRLQADLITDPEEKADYEILTAKDEIENNLSYFNNKLESIRTAKLSFSIVKDRRAEVIEFLNALSGAKAKYRKENDILVHKNKCEAINDSLEDETDPIKIEKLNKQLAKLQAEKYDVVNDPENRYISADYSKDDNDELYKATGTTLDFIKDYERFTDKRVGAELYNKREHIRNLFQDFRRNYKGYRAAFERILKPLNIDFVNNPDIDPTVELQKKIEEFQEQLNNLDATREARILELMKSYQADRAAMVTVEQRIAEFAEMNYLLDEKFPEHVKIEVGISDQTHKLEQQLAEANTATELEETNVGISSLEDLNAAITSLRLALEYAEEEAQIQELNDAINAMELTLEYSDATEPAVMGKGGKVKDWTEPKHLPPSDWQILKRIKKYYDEGDYETAMYIAMNADTIIRDEIPPNIWVAIGGKLTPAGEEKLRLMKESGEVMANGGVINNGYTLQVQHDFKYKNIANRWLEDYDEKNIRYKLAVLLLREVKNPDKILGLDLDNISDYNKYSRLLRGLDNISSSKHEMSWRTENYNISEAEKWARESLREIFYLEKDFTKMEQGGNVGEIKHGNTFYTLVNSVNEVKNKMSDWSNTLKGEQESIVVGTVFQLEDLLDTVPTARDKVWAGEKLKNYIDEMREWDSDFSTKNRKKYIDFTNELNSALETYNNGSGDTEYYAKGGEVGERTALNEEERQFIREESQESGQGYTYRAKVLFGDYIVLKEKNNSPIQKWKFDNYLIAKKISEKLNQKNETKMESGGPIFDSNSDSSPFSRSKKQGLFN